jgi:carbamoyltransferase
MTYNILGINPGHNGSAALLVDGEVVYYVEEERLSRQKYDANPFRAIIDICSKWHVDEIVLGGTSPKFPQLPWTGEDPYSALVRKFYPQVKVTNLGSEHHLGHAACAFYNSGFDECVVIVVDGAGSFKQEKVFEDQDYLAEGYEAESIWVCQKPSNFAILHKVYGNDQGRKIKTNIFDFDCAVTVTKAYEAVSDYLGFGFIEAGKTMGLAPYGAYDSNIPNLFVGNRGSKDVFLPMYPAGAFVDQSRFEYLTQKRDPKEWHKDSSKLTDVEKNLAWKIQHDTQNIIASLIETAVKITGIKKVAIVGGYGLNCVANYYYKKRFPEIELYCEPVSHDGGTAIGVARLVWSKKEFVESLNFKQTSIYYGPEYKKEDLEKILKNNLDKIKVEKIEASQIAKLIADKNIVSLFQGRSEAGPRALGNRSILYDPRDPNGKDYVNTVKGREWFRPFAGSCLVEDANDWFDMAGLEESPFMMYAVNVAADKVNEIPCITHVDDTCRVQTVSENQNKHYYELIKEFKKITGVPVLFNTSFNLAGEPLVETLDDALHTLYNSKLKYLYLPELGVLVTKTTDDPEPEEKTKQPLEVNFS